MPLLPKYDSHDENKGRLEINSVVTKGLVREAESSRAARTSTSRGTLTKALFIHEMGSISTTPSHQCDITKKQLAIQRLDKTLFVNFIKFIRKIIIQVKYQVLKEIILLGQRDELGEVHSICSFC